MFTFKKTNVHVCLSGGHELGTSVGLVRKARCRYKGLSSADYSTWTKPQIKLRLLSASSETRKVTFVCSRRR